VILALDEMSLYCQATLTRGWAPVGQTPLVSVHPQRDGQPFYGALNRRTGREIALRAPEQTSEMTANFVMGRLMRYAQPILLLLDRAAWHFGDAMRRLLAATDRVQGVHFPPACPDLNPQEHVGERARDVISHHHGYRRFDALLDDLETFLNATPLETNFMRKYAPPRFDEF
jgi:hypothetical protein